MRVLACLLALGAAHAILWAVGLPEGAGTAAFALRAMLLGALQVGAIALAWKRDDRATLVLLVAFGLVFRAAAWTWPPDLSSDLHRYVWDGRVQAAGESPYRFPPAAPELAALRDDADWPRINRPEAITVYPPGAQVAFRALAAVGGGSARGVKTAALAADLGVLALLFLALGRAGLPRGRIAIHAWSPLVVSEVACSGHLDALVVLLLLAGLLVAERGRATVAGTLLGAAAACKLYPALLFAALPAGRDRRLALVAGAGVVAAGYLLYGISAGPRVLGFLPDYVRSGEDFNLGLRALLEWLLGFTGKAARPAAMGLCAVALAAVVLAIARRSREENPDPTARTQAERQEPRRGGSLRPGVPGALAVSPEAPDLWTAARSVALAFVLLLPTPMHPWYALWLVPLLALRPSAAGLWIVTLLPLSYLKYGAPGGVMPTWIPVLEWLPAFALLAAERLRPALFFPVPAPARAPLEAA